MFYRNMCETCGGTLKKVDDNLYKCESCGNEYSVEKVEKYVEKLKTLFDEAKLEMVANARKNLYAAVTAKYISSNEVHECCVELKKYLPDDFQANFYDGVINKPKAEVAKTIRKIDVKADFDYVETIINFLIASLESEFVIATKDLIERAYYRYDKEKYYKYTSMVEDEAEKLDNYIYSTTFPRKAFVAYSSKDAEKAMELVETLESEGISCFISIRNLRHGAGSRENYDKSLKEAMDNCTSFVFVSSMNSRNSACDALRIEIPYVMQSDRNNAPGNLRNFYARIPNEYKKPRVEYRIEESKNENLSDELVDEFFDGFERVYTAKDVAKRVMRQAIGFDATTTKPQSEVKYCVACLSENDKNAQKCTECGNTQFAETEKEAELTKKLNDIQRKSTIKSTPASAPFVEKPKPAPVVEPKPIQTKLPESSARLEFELNKDGKSYTLKNKGYCIETNVVIGTHKGLPVTSIGDSAFESCLNLTSITIPNSVTSIGNSAFWDCSNLTSITIPNSVTSIGHSAFWGCSNLTSIAIPNSVTSIGWSAFSSCSKLTNISVDVNNTKYKSINGNVYTKDEKTLVCYAVGKTDKSFTIPNSVTSIGENAFEGCKNLTSITIPNSVTNIGDYAFSSCENLTSIIIPNSVTSIGDWAFYLCENLASITIPNSVTSIGDWAFCNCSNLTSITIPNSVTSIGRSAFWFSGLKNIYCFDNFKKIKGVRNASIKRRVIKLYYRETEPEKKLFKRYWHYVDGVPTKW